MRWRTQNPRQPCRRIPSQIQRHQLRAAPPTSLRADLEPLSDAVDPSVDYLDRADIAFALAGRLNEVWDQMNPVGAPSRPSAPGFVVHIDAPWGGGKSTFAEYLAQILNPYSDEGPMPGWLKALPLGDEKSWPERFRRPWHIVRFNAWQHQHVSPPWWVFYETVRQTCVKQSAGETNLREESELPPPMAAFGFARPRNRPRKAGAALARRVALALMDSGL